MANPWCSLTAIALCCLVVGCLEVDQQYTINPDRSARVRVKLAFDLGLLEQVPLVEELNLRQEILEAENTMRSLAAQCIHTAQGVDAWTDYRFLRDEKANRMSIAMTAYVPDVTVFALNPDSEEIPNLQLAVTESSPEKNTWVARLPGVNDFEPDSQSASLLAPDELAEILAERRLQFDEEATESKVLFEALRITGALRFPGRVLEASNARQSSRQEATVAFDGKRYYAMMRKILTDDQLARRAYAGGAELHSGLAIPGNEVNEWLFGTKGPVSIVVARGERALFDYPKELARARKNPPKL